MAGLPAVEIPEFGEAGVLMWRAELTGSGAVSLAAWGAARPTRRRWLQRLCRWTGTTVFAPHVGIETLGEHPWGEVTAVAWATWWLLTPDADQDLLYQTIPCRAR